MKNLNDASNIDCQSINPFSIWTNAYEKDLNEKYGIELNLLRYQSDLQNIDPTKNRLIAYDDKIWGSKMKSLLEIHKDVPEFCSMKIDNQKELMGHINFIYDLMFHHYILGKKSNPSFPHAECCPSAQNIMFAGMSIGYANASVLLDSYDDHCYAAFPFLLHDKKGFILADPTSNQLWWLDKNIKCPRNHIFVVEHNNWEYKTDWRDETDLYPNRYQNLHSIKENFGKNEKWFDEYMWDIDRYFEEVFTNPINVKINSS